MYNICIYIYMYYIYIIYICIIYIYVYYIYWDQRLLGRPSKWMYKTKLAQWEEKGQSRPHDVVN